MKDPRVDRLIDEISRLSERVENLEYSKRANRRGEIISMENLARLRKRVNILEEEVFPKKTHTLEVTKTVNPTPRGYVEVECAGVTGLVPEAWLRG